MAMRKSRIRITGNDRFFMMLARDVRRRWLQYGTNRKLVPGLCDQCKKREGTDIDHISPVGFRPRRPEDFSDYIYRMLYNQCQRLCSACHKLKTDKEREKRKEK